MNISSILITIVGIIIIIALYVMSRSGQNKLPKKEGSKLPNIKDDNGDVFTSILDDIPASDGMTPAINNNQTQDSRDKQQLVLFISAKNEQSLDGNLVKQALLKNGLRFGDKDIYHLFIESVIQKSPVKNPQQSNSLFRVANGVEPWTLKDQDLDEKQIVGLSMVMLLPTLIENKEALQIFIEKAESIAKQTNGVLKNQQQQILTDDDRKAILRM